MQHFSLHRGRLARRLFAAIVLMLAVTFLLSARTASAQTAQQRLDAASAHMKRLQDLTANLPASSKVQLSSGAQHIIAIAKQWDSLKPKLAQSAAATLNAPRNAQPLHPLAGTLPRGVISDPSTDLLFSRMAGFTQSETSTAWCGRSVVVAFNDSGSFLETFPIPGIGLSFNGYSSSSDGGRSFTDRGFLNPGPSVFNFLQGDPVVTCSDENTFYQSSIFATEFTNAVSFSKSTDGGRTFGDPVSAVGKSFFTHFIDKPWMAVDPSNPNKIYITYTDFDFSFTLCPTSVRLGIELVASVDGGATWSVPTVVDNGCFPNQNQGSNVAVDGAGNVYVAWEQFPAFLPTNEIDIAKSTNGGASFGPKAVVSIVTVVGSPFGLLQGGFRNNEFPIVAIDLSRGPGRGPVYLTWNDGGLGVTPDFFGFYNFGDVFVSRSNNGGSSWSSPVKVNDNDDGAGTPADHYQPGIAVDRSGSVGVCFYDRRRDPANFLIDRECASSQDHGRSWRNHRVTGQSFTPSISADLLINPVYMGDYDSTVADLLGLFAGFRGAFGDNSRGNPDVKISPRFGGETNGDDEDH